MMDPHVLAAFAGVALVLTMAPGLDTAMVLRTSAAESTRNGVMAAFGIGAGCLLWGFAVALGLGALLATAPMAFVALKWAGAIYLVWLGLKLLIKPRGSGGDPLPARAAPEVSQWAAFRRGFTTNILNPKVGVFYITLLPQFLPANATGVAPALLLAGIHVALAVTWFTILAGGAAVVRKILQRPPVARGLDLATGCVFVGFGASLVLASH
ncbi:LysE family translocator [Caulobacter sp. UNC279MFTsu5.1]|uniref:LysE family translocator n=1 Tax=Caulobacter sp. UNC279MFTsu5.1 TaxID=1502775 RepID=UPI0008E0661F|nr:LysE family translocator [Caulobacter sp. UNC279MFTsu5.1]SFI53560.1 Threonine/homoserine/homoserine lactone efflux protein [Caulobacter sp. UNC279MFTsu5.1]